MGVCRYIDRHNEGRLQAQVEDLEQACWRCMDVEDATHIEGLESQSKQNGLLFERLAALQTQLGEACSRQHVKMWEMERSKQLVLANLDTRGEEFEAVKFESSPLEPADQVVAAHLSLNAKSCAVCSC